MEKITSDLEMQPDWENLRTPGGVAISLGFQAVILAPGTSLWGPWKLCPLGCYKGQWLLWSLGLLCQGEPVTHQYGSHALKPEQALWGLGVETRPGLLGGPLYNPGAAPIEVCESNVLLGSSQVGAAVVKHS